MMFGVPPLMLAMVFVTCLTAGGCLLTWLQDRRRRPVLCIGISSFLSGAAIVTRAALPFEIGVVVTDPMLLVSFSLIWAAFRTLRGGPPEPSVIVLLPLLWVGLCFSPVFRAHMELRIGLGLLLGLIPVSLAAQEIWGLRSASGFIRLPLLGVMGFQMALMAQRAARSLLRPQFIEAPMTQVPGFNVLMFDLLGLMTVVSFSVISLVRDEEARRAGDA